MEYTREELNEKGVYAIINLVNGKRYIGSTSQSFKARWQRHISALNKNVSKCPHLQNSWNKYGEDNFEFKILETLREDLIAEWLLKREQWFMDLFGSYNKELGYNHCPIAGNRLGAVLSEKTRLKISISNTGRKVSDETRAKIAAAHKGHKMNEKTKSALLESRLGTKHSIETRLKISESLSKQNYKFLKPNGELLVINNLNKYCLENNLFTSNMHLVHTGKAKSHKGYVKYIDENTTPFKIKTYTIITPTDERIILENNSIGSFCKKYNLDCSCMYKVVKGIHKHHKGYKIILNE